jgi:predicted  nucleic acid-binding Zn-ribbon protein
MGESTGKPENGEADPRTDPLRDPARTQLSRRDPRADPDDDESASATSRVDVVQVERGKGEQGSSDTLTNAALTLRRELAKLHQQAAAVERTIEDQRRERSEVFDRIDSANARAERLEAQLAQAESETANVRRLHDTTLGDLQKVRTERDDLARAIDNAKLAAEELARAREEAETFREAHDEALRAASKYEAELVEIRKREQAGAQRVSDHETELSSFRERLERALGELSQAREESAQIKSELVRVRQELTATTESLGTARAEVERDRKAAQEQLQRLERTLGEARMADEKVTVLESDLGSARVENSEARSEIARLGRDLEAARHARDVNLERATMAERETSSVRNEIDRLRRDVETAVGTTARAETRALHAERARVAVEESIRHLRDEVTAAFARWRPPSVAPPAAERAPAAMTVMRSEAPPPTRPASTSFPPMLAEAAPLSIVPEPRQEANQDVPDDAPGSAPPLELDDDDWVAPSSRTASVTSPASPPAGEKSSERSSPRSVPPPLPARSRPRPLPPPARRATMPPAVYPSVPPGISLPSPRPPSPSEERSGVQLLPLAERAALIERLADPETARAAAVALRERPEWLAGRPPIELLTALTVLDYDVESPLFDLARAWDRDTIARALVAGLRDEPDMKLREHAAWLLKHLGAVSALPSIIDLVKSDEEPASVRRWLLEAIERLVASRAVGWDELGELVMHLARHPDPALRDGVIGVVASLDRSEEKRRLLLDLLRTDDDEIVLSSAVHALTSALPIELDPVVTERLLGHPSARVQRSVVDFIERSKRAARN